MIKYFCSNGERVSESIIKKRLSAAYKTWYEGESIQRCYGCGGRAIETSHIISKARCKELHKTQLIWEKDNTYPACRKCHQSWESIDSYSWCSLMIVDKCLEVLWKYDKESYNKRIQIYEEYHVSTKKSLGL